MKTRLLLPLLLAPFTSAFPAAAANIFVENAGFEALTGTDTNHFDPDGKLKVDYFSYRLHNSGNSNNSYKTPEPIPAWKITDPAAGEAGTYRPSTNSIPGGASEGLMVAYVNAGTPSTMISQVLCHVLTPGTYTLQVDVGRTRYAAVRAPYQVQLFAGGVVIAQDDSTLTVPLGAFVTSTCTVTIPTGHPRLGTHLEIRLIVWGPVVDGAQLCFDNVRLDGPPGPCLTIRRAVEITFPSETNKIYQVLWRTNPVSGAWTPLEIPTPWSGTTNLIPGDGEIRAVFDSVHGRDQRVYIVVEKVP